MRAKSAQTPQRSLRHDLDDFDLSNLLTGASKPALLTVQGRQDLLLGSFG